MNDGKHRFQYLIAGLAVAFLLLTAQLFRLQLLDNSFKISAENNALLYQTRPEGSSWTATGRYW